MTLVAAKYYEKLQEFFQTVRAADEEQAIITRIAAPVGH